VYRLAGGHPLAEVQAAGSGATTAVPLARRGDRLEAVVSTPRDGRLVVRETCTGGWAARVDGRPVGVDCVEGRSIGVPLAAGRRHVELRYRPPRFFLGLAASALSALAVAWLGRPLRRRPAPPDEPPA
jgi:uncharacterized membrane protein YfhO